MRFISLLILLSFTSNCFAAWTQRAADTFVDTSGADLTSHSKTGSAPLGDPWTVDSGQWKIGINNIGTNNSGSNFIARDTTVIQNKQACQATVALTNGYVEIGLRMDSSGNGYVIVWRSNIFADLTYFRLDSGVPTPLGASIGSLPGNQGDLARFEIDGSVLTAIIQGNTQATRSDSTYSSGNAGLFCDSGPNFQMDDDWVVFDDAGAASPSPKRFPFFYRRGS